MYLLMISVYTALLPRPGLDKVQAGVTRRRLAMRPAGLAVLRRHKVKACRGASI